MQTGMTKEKHVSEEEEASGKRGGAAVAPGSVQAGDGGEEGQTCSAIVQANTRSDVLRHRLEELTKELGGVKWRDLIGRSCWLEATASELVVVDEPAEYMAYCCAVRGNRESTVAGKLVAVNFSHEQ